MNSAPRYKEDGPSPRPPGTPVCPPPTAVTPVQADPSQHVRLGDLCRSLVQHAPQGIMVLDGGGSVVHANPTLERMLGYGATELSSIALCDLSFPEHRPGDHSLLRELVAGLSSVTEVDHPLSHRSGHVAWSRITLSPFRDDAGDRYVLAIVEDITGRREEEAARERERAYFDQLFESIPEGVAIVDPGDRILGVNPEFTRLFGYTEVEAVGRTLEELIVPPEEKVAALELTRRIAGGERVRADAVRRHKDGSSIDVAIVGSAVRAHGSDVAVCGIYQDIRDRKSMERALRRMSQTDALTGLLNRRGFFSLGARELELARRRGEEVLLLFIDLDDFKGVNDRLGHAAGDSILQDLAVLLEECFRSTDLLGRIGGDEFVVLGVSAGEEEPLVTRVHRAIERYNGDRDGPPISLSIGSVILPARDAESLEALLEEADARMYTGKRSRGGGQP
jgi:diguanylate cyclase (GGDEF)-like protein/PAS domain S-box-containing protein